MASDLGSIKHALAIARERGFAEVVVEEGDLKFRASLEPATAKKRANPIPTSYAVSVDEDSEGPKLIDVVAPMVGYFREADPAVAVGDEVTSGQVVGVVTSLGEIPYGVESNTGGEVVEVLVVPGQPVMYGQALIKVKP